MKQDTIRLLVSCADRRGIVAGVTALIAAHDGNVLEADQHTDADTGAFYMRLEIESASFGLSQENFQEQWQPIVERYGLTWQIHWGQQRKRMAILASRTSHCLFDLLYRWQTGELLAEIAFVACNHVDHQAYVEHLGLPYFHLPVTAETRDEQEAALQRLLEHHRVDLVVLARYMQILSPSFTASWAGRIINIHHSFLPAFSGGNPYRQAYDRGVKIIGATSHYVTSELDAGPIIAQDVTTVGHRDQMDDLIRKGRDLERLVLAKAVRLHLEDQILIAGNKTVVFE